jgi:excinuclease UvrABC ATPase subunit
MPELPACGKVVLTNRRAVLIARVIKTADWIIGLHLGGGSAGGRVIASGTPEQFAAVRGSYTGQFLARVVSEK